MSPRLKLQKLRRRGCLPCPIVPWHCLCNNKVLLNAFLSCRFTSWGFTLFRLQGFLCPARGSPRVPLPCLVCLGRAVLCGLDVVEVPKNRGSGAVVWQF